MANSNISKHMVLIASRGGTGWYSGELETSIPSITYVCNYQQNYITCIGQFQVVILLCHQLREIFPLCNLVTELFINGSSYIN